MLFYTESVESGAVSRIVNGAFTGGEWFHVASQAANGQFERYFVNGVVVSSNSFGTIQSGSLVNRRIGGSASGSASLFFDGFIDDAKMYTNLLSVADIGLIYTNSLSVHP